MSIHPTPDWDPRAPEVQRDQRRAYDEMRERCPVAYSDFLDWTLFRHQDVVGVVADPQTYSSVSHHRAIPNGMDPPEHARYRSVLEPYFQWDQMNTLEPTCRSIAVELLETLRAPDRRDHVDYVAAFAQPFAFRSLCAFLGWPQETWQELRGWTHGNQEATFSRNREAAAALAREFAGYVREALEIRRTPGAEARHDLTTSLMRTTVDGKPLSDADIVSILRNWAAGHGTVVAGLGILAFHLATDVDLQLRLRREPTRLPAAIDEILRVDGPLVANRRTTTREVQINGRTIGAGEKLSLNWIAANRDGRAFHDPDAVLFDRPPRDNLLFGAGIHYCLGAPMARLEMRVALEELFRCTNAVDLDLTRRPQREMYPSDGFQVLPVRLR